MNITFEKLKTSHFLLLYKWLMTPHVREWWDGNVAWTPELIEEKYTQYVYGYKKLILQDSIIQKPIYAFVILKDGNEVGYIQYYNKHDFPSEYEYETNDLPSDLAAIDIYIGDAGQLRQGIGSKVLNVFIEEFIFNNYTAVFVDPEIENHGAIHMYKKAGFIPIKTINGIIWMIKKKAV